MTNKVPISNDQNKPTPLRKAFDLEERTAILGEKVIAFAKTIPANRVTAPLISQLVRAATSVGANYCEADEADSRKEFRYRISVCKRESRETGFQLRMVVAAEPELRTPARSLWQESKELTRIFAAILRKK
jgi:four helix bundle protein